MALLACQCCRLLYSKPLLPWGFLSRSLLVLSGAVAAMGFHVLQKKVAAVGNTDEVRATRKVPV
jgi:hypothetical protein